MSDAPAAATTPEPEPTPESVTFNVKSNNDTRYSITMPLTARVTELKDKLSELADIPSDRQRLIYSGRVMKNDDTLETYKIKSGNTVHMVKGAASNPTPAPATAPAVPRNLASGSGNNPLAGLTGARYAGHVQLPSADIFGPDGGMGPPPNPEYVAEALSDPGMRAQMAEMLRNPAMLDMIINSNPSLRALGPGARELMQSDMFRQMVTDPQLIRQFGAGGFGGPQNPAFPAPGNLDGNDAPPASDTNLPANPFASLFSANPQQQQQQQQQRDPLADLLQHHAGDPGASNPQGLQNFLNAMGGMGAPAAGTPAPGTNPFAALFGGAPPAAPAPADTRAPEDRYADQLRQLNEMGFHNFEQNVAALRRSGGDVQGAIEQLLSGN